MYHAPAFPHKPKPTDFLLVRNAKGKVSLRRIDATFVVGQQEPLVEVMSPNPTRVGIFQGRRLRVDVQRQFAALHKEGNLPRILVAELALKYPTYNDPLIRKWLKPVATTVVRGSSWNPPLHPPLPPPHSSPSSPFPPIPPQRYQGRVYWQLKKGFAPEVEEELQRVVKPEEVCSYESMQAGLYRLKRLGIKRLTDPSPALTAAITHLPDDAMKLAASSHIERELELTAWHLSGNFVGARKLGKGSLERLEMVGAGDPSGRGLGFSFLKPPLKPPNLRGKEMEKKAAAARGGVAVTGTDADLRRLNMEEARKVGRIVRAG